MAINAANLGRKPYIPLDHHITALLVDVGFQLRGEIIWQKAKGAFGSTAWGTWQSARNPALRDVHEYIVVAPKGPFGKLSVGNDAQERTIRRLNISPRCSRTCRGRRRGVDAEHKKTPSPIWYGLRATRGRTKSWRRLIAPPPISPPTLFGLYIARSPAVRTWRATIRSRNPGANRSIWRSMASVTSPS